MNCPSQDAKEGTEADCAKEGAHALPSPDSLDWWLWRDGGQLSQEIVWQRSGQTWYNNTHQPIRTKGKIKPKSSKGGFQKWNHAQVCTMGYSHRKATLSPVCITCSWSAHKCKRYSHGKSHQCGLKQVWRNYSGSKQLCHFMYRNFSELLVCYWLTPSNLLRRGSVLVLMCSELLVWGFVLLLLVHLRDLQCLLLLPTSHKSLRVSSGSPGKLKQNTARSNIR